LVFNVLFEKKGKEKTAREKEKKEEMEGGVSSSHGERSLQTPPLKIRKMIMQREGKEDRVQFFFGSGVLGTLNERAKGNSMSSLKNLKKKKIGGGTGGGKDFPRKNRGGGNSVAIYYTAAQVGT